MKSDGLRAILYWVCRKLLIARVTPVEKPKRMSKKRQRLKQPPELKHQKTNEKKVRIAIRIS
jgi:hypothetical protein